MEENKSTYIQNDKIKKLLKKIFNKKTIIAAVIILVLGIGARIGFSLLFEIEGTVSKVDGSNLTVSNFLTTQTIDVGAFQTADNSIKVGDRIEIMKNLSGDVISVRDGNFKHGRGDGKVFNNGRNGQMNQGGRGGMRKR